MQRPTTLLAIAFLTALAGFVAGWTVMATKSLTRLNRIVTVSWGDASDTKAFYGAYVYLYPKDPGYSVRARVYMGHDNNNVFYYCGELGLVRSEAEAVAQWGRIDWRADGLHIGSGTNHYFVAIAELDRFRRENRR
jgi:hypothetical protein